MPNGDRTGPMGMGPGSGRAAGLCAGFDTPGFATSAPGRGFGRGRGGAGRGFGGGGRGWRHWFYATGLPGWMRFRGGMAPSSPQSDPESEKQALKSQAQALQSTLDSVQKRLDELEPRNAAGQ